MSTPANYDILESAGKSLNDALTLIGIGEQCGYDCVQFRKLAQQYQQELDKVRNALFPHGRPRS